MSEEIKAKREQHGIKCQGKFNLCWPWHEYTRGSIEDNRAGLGFVRFSDINLNDTKIVAFTIYNKKKMALNFCPFCGEDYRRLKRI